MRFDKVNVSETFFGKDVKFSCLMHKHDIIPHVFQPIYYTCSDIPDKI